MKLATAETGSFIVFYGAGFLWNVVLCCGYRPVVVDGRMMGLVVSQITNRFYGFRILLRNTTWKSYLSTEHTRHTVHVQDLKIEK